MEIYSSLALVNRSIQPFKDIAQAMTAEPYSQTCKVLQNLLHNLYGELLKHHYEGLGVEYRLSNETGHWMEFLHVHEMCHSTNYFSVSLDSAPEVEVRESISSMRYRRLVSRLKDHLSGPEYTHILFHEVIEQFALSCTKLLATTHTFELEINEGMLYLKATPLEGYGVLRLISRSHKAVLNADLEQMSRMNMADISTITANMVMH
jgi:hypothetical protein